MDHKTHKGWAITILFIFIILCATVIYLNKNPFTMRIEMDNNTRDAILSLNYSAMGDNDKTCFEGCEFGFTRGEYQVIAVDGFDRTTCVAFCGGYD